VLKRKASLRKHFEEEDHEFTGKISIASWTEVGLPD
jgi:hypothetical protein